MKQSTWQKKFPLLLAVVLMISTLGSIGYRPEQVDAAGQMTIKVLEITDTGQSDLQGISNSSNFKLELATYSMKQFVASRDYLDGKYDAVYIGKGDYNVTPVSEKVMNTSSYQNDITSLKVNEIKSYFVDKGLPLIAYKDSTSGPLKQPSSGNLNKFITSVQNKGNVSFVNSSEISNASTFAAKTSILTKGNLRPRLSITSKPSEYAVTNKIYNRGETITYSYDVGNVSNLNNLTVNLYLGIDSALPFTAEQIVASTSVTASNGSISYTLPRAYSGPRYWRLELVDQSSGLKDVKSGGFRYKGEPKQINVLQFRGNNSGDDAGLDKDYNFDSSYLVRSGDYEIKFTASAINSFNGPGGPAGYKNLQSYDMLIFGFAHEYKEFAFIEIEAARNALQSYINSGKSVMLTHDTFNPYSREGYRSAYWNEFKSIAGMIEPANNMGNAGDNYFTTGTKKVNSGLLTDYPFVLPNDVAVTSTHGQYFTLDLGDPNVIPWYNLSGGGRTTGDSWNHYFSYSKGNITFTNSGHLGQTRTGYTEGERQLFTNTMYRAFTTSNHGPVITVFSPDEYNSATDNFIPSTQDIPVHYLVEDLDMGDTALTTSINFIYNGITSEQMSSTNIRSGDTINQSFANPLPSGGDLTVEIIAKDSKGAESRKQIKVKIKKVSASLELSRSFSSNVVDNKVDTDSIVEMNYTITPKPITGSGSSMNVTNVTFTEQLPPNLDVAELPPNFTKSGDLATGIRVSGSLNNIQYTKKGTDTKYTADPITFTIKAIPTKQGFYPLTNGSLSFKDMSQSTITKLPFPSYTLEAVTKLKTLSLKDQTILVGDSVKLLPEYTPADLTNVPFKWESNAPGLVTVNNTGLITGKAKGTANITITALDGSGLTATAKINVVEPGLFISGPDHVSVGDEITLSSRLITADYEQITSYTWSIVSGSDKISINPPPNEATIKVTGKLAGSSTVKLTVNTNQGNTYSATAPILVKSKLTALKLNNAKIYVGKEKVLLPEFTPADVTNKLLTWESSDESTVSVTQDGRVEGLKVGTAQITITSKDGSNITTNATVEVIDPNPGFSTDAIELGKEFSLTADAMELADGDSIASYSWNVDGGTGRVELKSSSPDQTVSYRALKQGDVDIKLTITTVQGHTKSTTKPIRINPVKLQLPKTMTVEVTNTDMTNTKELYNLLVSNPIAGKTNIQDFLKWKSDDISVVSVDANGKITAHKPGATKITVYSEHDSAVIATTTITVKKQFNGKGKY